VTSKRVGGPWVKLWKICYTR